MLLCVPGTKTRRSVLDVGRDVLRIHFASECVHGAQIHRHLAAGCVSLVRTIAAAAELAVTGWGTALRFSVWHA